MNMGCIPVPFQDVHRGKKTFLWPGKMKKLYAPPKTNMEPQNGGFKQIRIGHSHIRLKSK